MSNRAYKPCKSSQTRDRVTKKCRKKKSPGRKSRKRRSARRSKSKSRRKSGRRSRKIRRKSRQVSRKIRRKSRQVSRKIRRKSRQVSRKIRRRSHRKSKRRSRRKKPVRIKLTKEGSLGRFGYRMYDSAKKRHQALAKAVEYHGYLPVFRRVNVLYVFNKNKRVDLAMIAEKDKRWLRKTYRS